MRRSIVLNIPQKRSVFNHLGGAILPFFPLIAAGIEHLDLPRLAAFMTD